MGQQFPSDSRALLGLYLDWCAENGIDDEGDASRHLDNPNLTPAQREWLTGFLAAWVAADEAEIA